MTKQRPQPQYAGIFESGDTIILYCAYCGVKLHQGDPLLKVWNAKLANLQDIREQRSGHDMLYHQGFWNRH